MILRQVPKKRVAIPLVHKDHPWKALVMLILSVSDTLHTYLKALYDDIANSPDLLITIILNALRQLV